MEIASDDRKIAPGCSATMKVPLCSFEQFIEYLWAPDKKGSKTQTRPDVSFGRKYDFYTDDFGKLVELVDDYNRRHPGNSITNFIDNSRLGPNVPDRDYFKMIEEAGGVIGKLQAFTPEFTTPKREPKRLVDKGEKGLQHTLAWRTSEMEKFRLPFLDNLLKGVGLEIKLKLGPSAPTGRLAPYKVYDAAATVKQKPEMAEAIQSFEEQYKSASASNRNHVRAVDSAKKGAMESGCTLG